MKPFFNDIEAKEFGEVISVLIKEMGHEGRKFTAKTLDKHIGKREMKYEVIHGAKVAYRIIPGKNLLGVFVEYIYLPKHLRGKGTFKKVMDSLEKHGDKVFYEPSSKWIKENWNKPMPQIMTHLFQDGVKRDYLIHGSKKELVVEPYMYQQALDRVAGYGKKEVGFMVGVEAYHNDVPDSIRLTINMFMLFHAIDETDARSGNKIQ